MRLALTEEQEVMGSTLHELLGSARLPTIIRAWSNKDPSLGLELWGRLAEFGVMALCLDERYGGLDTTAGHLVTAFYEIGHHAVPGPYVESCVFVPTLLSGLGDEELAETWLTPLGSGERVATCALFPVTPFALDVHVSDAVFVVDGERLECVAATPSSAVEPSVDPGRWLGDLPADRAHRVAEGPNVRSAATAAGALATLASAAQLLGLGEWLLDAGRDYALERRQFGRPIGEFQAVKHHLADVAVGLAFARPLIYGAAAAVEAGKPTAVREIAMAKLFAGQAADLASRVALQVHGAMGYTDEYDLSLWLKKVWALERSWGGAAYQRRLIGQDLGL